MKALKLGLVIGIAGVLALPAGVQAVLVAGNIDNPLGTHEAQTVIYSNVVETTDHGTYGTPSTSLVSDLLDFNPNGIRSESSAGLGELEQHSNDARLEFYVLAKPGNFIEGLLFSELGDYTLDGLPEEFANSYAKAAVGATFTVEINAVNGVPVIGPALNDQFSIENFNPYADGQMELSDDGPVNAAAWDGSVLIDFEQMLIDGGYDPESDGVTEAFVVLDNVLTTISFDGGSAEIAKKDADGFTVTVIPEPASLALVLGTASLAVFIRRRLI